MKLTIEIDTTSAEQLAEARTLLGRFAETTGAVNTLKSVEKTKPVKNQTETASEATKTKKASPSIPKEETPVENTSEPLTLADVKQLAQECVAVTNRDKVKVVIHEFGSKLTEVAESDYEALAAKLTELKG